jgi:superfamily II DNA or RNA helicase
MNNYFKNIPAEILKNENLRDPQKFAYVKALHHYTRNKNPERETVIVLPTGTGKTGLISILPFGICEGRVLIVTPQLTIKKGILNNLTNGADSFYVEHGILNSAIAPEVGEYKSKLPSSVYKKCNIIVVNIQRLQERLNKSLIKQFPKDFFDMIIIDEAHHSTAKTWLTMVEHFNNAKIIKLTATPFRSDNEVITGKEIYNYPLSSAMTNGYIKSLENITYIPEELYLSIDKNKEKYYTVEKIREMGIKNEDWISRSVAYSRECSNQIVEKSIELLKEKKRNSNIPHKIIAIACSVVHAEEIKELYEELNYKVAIIHSNVAENELEKNFKDIENHRVDVIINVAMLGEGYDHKYLSIAAIFRPFRTLLPYTQFIGRILRIIPEGTTPSDNIGRIIAHKNLNLQELWGYYRAEIEKSNISIELKQSLEKENILNINPKNGKNLKIKNNDIGMAIENGESTLEIDTYLNTEITKKAEEEKAKDEAKIKQLQEIMEYDYNFAKEFYYADKMKKQNIGLNRPDLIFINTKQLFDSKIKEEIIPNLLIKTKHNLHEKTLANTDFFKYNNSNKWIADRCKDNGGILARYIAQALKKKIGRKREEWEDKDFEIANVHLDKIVEYLEGSLLPKK